MIPSSGCSISSGKPVSIQKVRTTGHTCSGVPFTTSQRWSPERSMRAPSTFGSTFGPVAAGVPRCCPCCAYCEYEVCARGSGIAKRSSIVGAVSSGGTSSGCAGRGVPFL